MPKNIVIFSDGTGQDVGALKAGMLGLCGEESRRRALAGLSLTGLLDDLQFGAGGVDDAYDGN